MSDTQKSAYCGFQPYSYRDFTKQLRQLLQDRYTWDGDGFTILKELIQNANDAGATSLHLGWSPPLFDATSIQCRDRTLTSFIVLGSTASAADGACTLRRQQRPAPRQ